MKTYFRIVSYARPYLGKIIIYAIATILAVIFAGVTLAMLQPLLELLFNPENKEAATKIPDNTFTIEYLKYWIEQQATELQTEYGQARGLLYVTLFIVILNLVGNIFRYISSRYLGTIRTKVVEDLREDTFKRMVRLQVAYMEGERKGDLMTKVTADITEVEHSIVITFESIIRDPFHIIFFFSLLIAHSWQLTLFIFIVLPVAALVISKVSRSLRKDAYGTQDMYGRIMSVVDETISGIRIIKAFNAEGYTKKVFDSFNQKYSYLSRRQFHKRALVPVFSETSSIITLGLILWYGGNLVYEGTMAASGLFVYLALFSQMIKPAKSLSQSFSNIYRGIASADRIFQLMDAPLLIHDKPNAVEVREFKNVIQIDNVSFAYQKEFVLKNIDLRFEKGKMYALVGPSGSGKSTLAELILRFYDTTKGQITIDGVDLRDMKLTSLRSLIAVVTQEPILFNDTVYNNIAFGLPDVTEEQVIAAAKAAHAHEFVIEMEGGYQTQVGDRGSLLSGGQRQRISIARAILKNPPILILDEATSALDTSSEKIVQEALSTLMEHRTSIVIAHRLSTIQDADEIIVLEKGQIVERGKHQELIAKDGLYNTLYRLQQLEE